MKIDYYGHNCYVLSGKHVKIVTDPWLSEKGAFLGSWFQWPINHHLINNLTEDLSNEENTYIYISHEHQDHFDLETLNKLRQVCSKCIIPLFHDKYLKNQLNHLGYKIIELNDKERFNISVNDRIELYIVDNGVNHDSAAIIEIENKVFLNQNDCKIFDRLRTFSKRKIDYYAVQFSGATWHPVCYDYDNDKKVSISQKKVLSKLLNVKKSLQKIKPQYYFPSAGPPIFPFLDKNLSLGEGNIFVHQNILAKYLEKIDVEIIYLKPGETFGETEHKNPIMPPSIYELRDVNDKVDCIFDHIKDSDLDIEKLKASIHERLNKIHNLKFNKCPIIYFNWGEKDKFKGIKIDINAGIVLDTKEIDSNEFIELIASPSYFHLMSDKNFRWQDIYLSLRAKVRRHPDVFNTFTNIFLFSDASNISNAFQSTLNINNERIVIVNETNGKPYEINRYCPHNGADLIDAFIGEDGMLICPRHSWEFDLVDGGKCSHANVSIQAEEINGKKFK